MYLHFSSSASISRSRNALVKLGDEDVASLLVDSLRHGVPEVRYDVVWALGELGNATACQVLGDVLKDWDDDVRHGAVSALGQLGRSMTVLHMMAAMDDHDESVRREAANIHSKLDDVHAAGTDIPT